MVGLLLASGLSGQNQRVTELRAKAQEGDPSAWMDLADHFRTGDGVPASPDSMYFCWERAADLGHAPAEYLIGLAYLRGIGKDSLRNEAKAVLYLGKAAQQNQPQAVEALLEYYTAERAFFAPPKPRLRPKDYELLFRYSLAAARAGSPRAATYVGDAYLKANGVARNDTLARAWLTVAALHHKDPIAQLKLGTWYLDGRTKFGYDLERSQYLFELALKNKRSDLYEIAEGKIGIHYVSQYKRQLVNLHYLLSMPYPPFAPQLYINMQ
jgi:TPR repeat protein